jgi:hypothetical protein
MVRFGDYAKHWAVYDYHWLLSRLFMSLLQGNTYSPLILKFSNFFICYKFLSLKPSWLYISQQPFSHLARVGSFPDCSCEYFKDMAAKSLGKHGQWTNCKHLYFIYTIIGNLDSNRDAFIHAPSFSFNEVKRILESGILANRIP